jgi:hypothetical protein
MVSQGETDDAEPGGSTHEDRPFVEPRWPIALVLSAFIVVTVVLRLAQPQREGVGPHWLVPALEIGLLAALIAANPADVLGRARWLRPLSIALVLTLLGAALFSDTVLIVDLVKGAKITQSGGTLLASGALIWLGNAIVFGLLYWLLDSGGPLARYRHERPHPDFAFSQQLNPELAPPGWLPRYVDLLDPRHHDEHGVQPNGRHAHAAVGETDHGLAVPDLAHRDRPRDRKSHQRVQLAPRVP